MNKYIVYIIFFFFCKLLVGLCMVHLVVEQEQAAFQVHIAKTMAMIKKESISFLSFIDIIVIITILVLVLFHRITYLRITIVCCISVGITTRCRVSCKYIFCIRCSLTKLMSVLSITKWPNRTYYFGMISTKLKNKNTRTYIYMYVYKLPIESAFL